MTDKSNNSTVFPQLYKENEFNLMIKFVKLGLWRDTNLSKVCHVHVDTIREWKKRPEILKAYEEAAESVMKKRKAVGDPDKLMKELHLEVDVDRLDITSAGQPIFGGKSVKEE